VPRYMMVILQDVSSSYETTFEPGLLSGQPFTLVFPFDGFSFRGGGAGLPDFSRIRTFHFTVGVVEGGAPDDLKLSVELDRIRVGRIPEPASSSLAILGLAMCGARRRFSWKLVRVRQA